MRVDDATQKAVGNWTGAERVGSWTGAERVGGWRAERQAAEEKLAWKNGGAVNTRHRNREARRQKGSSEEESQDV